MEQTSSRHKRKTLGSIIKSVGKCFLGPALATGMLYIAGAFDKQPTYYEYRQLVRQQEAVVHEKDALQKERDSLQDRLQQLGKKFEESEKEHKTQIEEMKAEYERKLVAQNAEYEKVQKEKQELEGKTKQLAENYEKLKAQYLELTKPREELVRGIESNYDNIVFGNKVKFKYDTQFNREALKHCIEGSIQLLKTKGFSDAQILELLCKVDKDNNYVLTSQEADILAEIAKPGQEKSLEQILKEQNKIVAQNKSMVAYFLLYMAIGASLGAGVGALIGRVRYEEIGEYAGLGAAIGAMGGIFTSLIYGLFKGF